MSRYECSAEAASLWGRLRNIYQLVQPEIVSVSPGCDIKQPGDAAERGVNWAERALGFGKGGHSDLGANSRLLYATSERSLELLAVMGQEPQIAARLARRALSRKSLWEIRQRYGLDKETAGEWVDGVKVWIWWHWDDDAPLELPYLPFGCVTSCQAES